MISPKKLRGPKGRVMWANSYKGIAGLYVHKTAKLAFAGRCWSDRKPDRNAVFFPVAVIPVSSAKAARAIVRLHSQNEAELAWEVAKVIKAEDGKTVQRGRCKNYLLHAYAVLAALGLKGRDR